MLHKVYQNFEMMTYTFLKYEENSVEMWNSNSTVKHVIGLSEVHKSLKGFQIIM